MEVQMMTGGIFRSFTKTEYCLLNVCAFCRLDYFSAYRTCLNIFASFAFGCVFVITFQAIFITGCDSGFGYGLVKRLDKLGYRVSKRHTPFPLARAYCQL